LESLMVVGKWFVWQFEKKVKKKWKNIHTLT
jgi:hypothetical protein